MKQTLILTLVSGADPEISCPNLICGNPPAIKEIVPDLCYHHDITQPTEVITFHSCNWYRANGHSRFSGSQERICELDTLNDEYAWVNEKTQNIEMYDTAAHLISDS